ncbi:hypothetical protein ZIOFF_057701 [Zingiber officinale]|uniref:Geranylgeranyl diphosphate reductase, chloroplastic n=1 Tax=Zingiber officinale TaxID=94328 RepID=A0A8J5F7A0_ZINOF|nr:hypothetical protein ZIOFF_057701 [Zingiber officinale]
MQNEETRAKIGAGVREGWRRRRQRLSVQDDCFFEWKNIIAEFARKGYAGEYKLQWDSFHTQERQLKLEWLESIEKRKQMPKPKGNSRAPKSYQQCRKILEAILAKWTNQISRGFPQTPDFTHHSTKLMTRSAPEQIEGFDSLGGGGKKKEEAQLSGAPFIALEMASIFWRRGTDGGGRNSKSASRTSAHLNGQKLRVAVVGGGPVGGETAETLAKGGVETILIERKLDNCKPCGGAIPLCMVEEFGLPLDLIYRHVTKMKMISPSNVALGPHVYIGMVRCEVLDAYLRGRAAEAGASVIKGLFLRLDLPKVPGGIYRITYNEYSGGGAGERRMAEVDAVIGADGANSRVAKSIEAGEYKYAIAFQERVKIPEAMMEYYKEPAEMYIGDDVSPNFYRWVFPKCDHVAVGTGTVTHKANIKKFQAARRLRAKDKIEGGTIIRVEAHPIPEHPRPRRYSTRESSACRRRGRLRDQVLGHGDLLRGEERAYVQCAEDIVEGLENGSRMIE